MDAVIHHNMIGFLNQCDRDISDVLRGTVMDRIDIPVDWILIMQQLVCRDHVVLATLQNGLDPS